METQQDLSTDELIFSLEQTVSEDSALRKDLTELFSNSFDPEIFAKLRERNPFFANIVSNIIRNKLESRISSVEIQYVKEREPIHKNIEYYESLPARIKEVEEREGRNSEEYIALTKENGRKGPILEKYKRKLERLVRAEKEEIAFLQNMLDSRREDPEINHEVYLRLKKDLWYKINQINLKERNEEILKRNLAARAAQRLRRGILYVAGGIALVAGIVFGTAEVIELTREEEKQEKEVDVDRLLEITRDVASDYLEGDELPHPDELRDELAELINEPPQEEIVKPQYEIAAEYKPGDIMVGRVGTKRIVYQGIIYQDGRPFLNFLNDQIADSATHSHEIDEENLDDGFDNEPDCRPFLGKYIFDVDIKSQRIRLLREVIHRDFKPFEHTGIQYTQHVTMPITELATLRPQWGVPNKYLISEDPHDPGKKFVQIIWLRKTTMEIDTKGQGYLSNAVLSTPINLTNIDFDEMPDCVIEGEFPGERFYLDVNQNGDIRFLKKVR